MGVRGITRSPSNMQSGRGQSAASPPQIHQHITNKVSLKIEVKVSLKIEVMSWKLQGATLRFAPFPTACLVRLEQPYTKTHLTKYPRRNKLVFDVRSHSVWRF